MIGRISLATLLSLSCLSARADGEFIELGELYPNGRYHFSIGVSVSADGTIVAGDSDGQGFLWTRNEGMVSLDNQNGVTTADMSADGSTVVGSVNMGLFGAPLYHSFVWTAKKGFRFIGSENRTFARAVSGDGSIVVGADGGEPFRWTEAEGIRPLTGYSGPGYAWDVSADGSTVVGTSGGSFSGGQAFRWTEQSSVAWLNPLSGYLYGSAEAVSGDGAAIAGYFFNTSMDPQAFRWTEAGGAVGLGFLSGDVGSMANAISDDGTTVVGTSFKSHYLKGEAFRWTEASGMQSVAQWLADAGVPVPAGMVLATASGTNRDGSVVVGTSSANWAWLARVDGRGGGMLTDLQGYNRSLIEANSRARIGPTDLTNLTLSGAHHRSLLDGNLAAGGYDSCAWAVADGARYERSHAELFEIGACTGLGKARMGLGLGKAQARQEWSLGGEGRYRGEYMVAEFAGQLGENLQASLLGYYGRFDVDSSRNYLNGATLLSSVAEPDSTAKAAKARLDWKHAAMLGGFGLTPYAVYSWSETKLDAYVEKGGGFPAAYDASGWSTSDARLGIAGEKKLSSRSNLRIAMEGVHRFESSMSGVHGHVLGLFDFDLPGQSVKRNWMRVLVDFDRQLSERSSLSLGAHGASTGGDADWGVSVGFRQAF